MTPASASSTAVERQACSQAIVPSRILPSSTTHHRHSRSIVDIIAAVERSKSSWQTSTLSASSPATFSPFSYANSVLVTHSVRDADALHARPIKSDALTPLQANSLRATALSASAWPALPSSSHLYRQASVEHTAAAADTVALPPPLHPSASRQEHHRYYYALRKATRLRKQQASAGLAVLGGTTLPTNAAASDSAKEKTINSWTRARSTSFSSSLSGTSASPTAIRTSSALSTSSATATTATATATEEIGTVSLSWNDTLTTNKSYNVMLSAWQQARSLPFLSSPWTSSKGCTSLRSDQHQDLLMLLHDDDCKEETRLFEELDACLRMQFEETLSERFAT